MATTKAARKPAAKKAPAKEVKGKNTTGRAGVLTRIRRGETLTKRLMRMRLIYSYGGGRVAGHITTPLAGQKWTDCSGLRHLPARRDGDQAPQRRGVDVVPRRRR
jgi:hypothetical protein